MRTTEFRPIHLILPDRSTCYQIPAFQRNFQWGYSQLHGLVRDIQRAIFHPDNKPHWIGVALIASASQTCDLVNTEPGHVCYDVLDGQQRLLTTRIWIVALLDEYHRQTGKHIARYKRSRVTDVRVHALDAEDWEKISNPSTAKDLELDESQSAMIRAYLYFRQIILHGVDGLLSEEELPLKKKPQKVEQSWLSWLIESLGNQTPRLVALTPEEIEQLIDDSLSQILLTTLVHETTDEDVEVIFETLNAKRAQLGQWDLFRNYVLIKSQTHGQEQKELYTKSLAGSEKAVNAARLDIRQSNLDRFLYDYLISEGIGSTRGTLRQDATSLEFRKYWDRPGNREDIKTYMSEKLIPGMQAWLAAIGALREFQFDNRVVKLEQPVWRTLRRIENLSRGPLVPLTSRIIRDWGVSRVNSQAGLLRDLKLVETFVARMLLSGEAFSPLRSMIIGACNDIYSTGGSSLEQWVRENSPKDERIRKVLGQTVAQMKNGAIVEPDPAGWINEQEFYQRASNKQIRAIFDALTEHKEGRLATVLVDEPGKRSTTQSKITIEHFYPQSPVQWLADLKTWGVAHQLMENRLHAIGNIGVLPEEINKAISNSPLHTKKSKLDELAVPHWRVNLAFHNAAKWTPTEIDSRTNEVIRLCLELWRLP